jgi:hypothetical protein
MSRSKTDPKSKKEVGLVMRSLYDDPITAKITQLSFYSKNVRQET